MGCCDSQPKKEPVKKVEVAASASPASEPPRPSPNAAELRAIKISEDNSQFPLCRLKGGKITPCFPEGLVYRIENGTQVCYYNDTIDYIAHVEDQYDPLSSVNPGDLATLELLENDWRRVTAVVHPLETVLIVFGTFSEVKTRVTLEKINAENMREFVKNSEDMVNKELADMNKITGGETNPEIILKRCVEKGVMFVDKDFLPKQSALTRPQIDTRQVGPLPFYRPSEYLPTDIQDQSDDILGPICPASVSRGYLGDCWVTCAMAIMANSEALIKQIFSHGNAKEKAVGAYRVLLRKNGWAEKLILDNYLPTAGGYAAFASIKDDPRELWASLFQKAYAKVNGSFSAITGGDALHVIQDFTGAPIYRFDKEFNEATKSASKAQELFKTILDYVAASHTLVLSTPSDNDAQKSKLEALSLRLGSTYLVDRVEKVKDTLLFHVLNPNGLNKVWRGAWGEGAQEWKDDNEAKVRCKPSWNKKGEFWMAWGDIIQHFNGGGFLFNLRNFYNYSVRGAFIHLLPTISLEVRASETSEVLLTLNQRDKRGLPIYEPEAMFGAILLSVAEETGVGMQKVVQCTTVHPLKPRSADQEFSFVADRSVSMLFKFEAGKSYYIVPRLHSGGMVEDHTREYVITLSSATSLKSRLTVVPKILDKNNRVLRNLVSFETTGIPSVQAEIQALENNQLQSYVSDVVLSSSA